MARTILVVDDNAINRQILMAGLVQDYDILEAEDGKEALAVIHRRYRQLSAVLLDIQMPVMDGYGVLRAMRESPLLAQLPVIVVTGSDDEETRMKALELGANDFIHKPCNPEIVRHCLKNNIALREAASIVNAIQKDKLTGIYNREHFFAKAGELIASHPPGYYMLACFDIDNFKLINDQYGAAEGDRILRHIGVQMQATFNEVDGVCGRISGDNFAGLFPNRPELIEIVAHSRETKFIPPDTNTRLRFSVGRYVVTDNALPVSALYDRAYIAKQSIKGRYDQHVADFDDSMLNALVREQEIIGEMDGALANREFEAWFQPQYNHATGALIGAEALARWRHPTKGMISPGEFVPVFEKNGFVYELDKYIWEEACRYLRKWIDEGRNPLPVSVNISRNDVFRDDLTDVLTGFIAKYQIPAELLRLEITESAFAGSSDQIIAAVKRFIALGFTVEIDDFGSGYSSLNTLKDVPAQIIKLDMRFLEGTDSAQRGGYILESIVRMARWLGTAVIAEGVETVKQADFLKSIGCNYVQGYYYESPMPAAKYENLAKNAVKEERLLSMETVENLDSESFWNPNSMDTLIFNSFVGGACVFEFCNGEVELLRVNDNYIRELGIHGGPDASLDMLDPFRYMDEAGKQAIRDCARKAIATATEQSGEFTLTDTDAMFDEIQYLRFTLRVIARATQRYLFYCVIGNITAQRQAERKEREAERRQAAAAEQLRAIMANIDGGVTASVNRDGVIEYIFANDRFFELLGCTREQYTAQFSGAPTFVYADDRARVAMAAQQASKERASYSVEYRIIRQDGIIRWLRSNVTLMDFPGIDEPVQLAVVLDITEQAQANDQLKFLNEMARVLLAQPDAEQGLGFVLRKLREYFDGARSYIFEFDFGKNSACNTYESCAEGVSREKDNLQNISLDVMSFWLDAFKRQDYYAIENVEALDDSRARERALLMAQGIRAIFVVPLYRDGKLIGMLGIDDPGRQYAQMGRLAALGDYIAVMLTRRDLSAQIVREDSALLIKLRQDSPDGLREIAEKDRRLVKRIGSPRSLLALTLALLATTVVLILYSVVGQTGGIASFSEPVRALSEDWTLTDGAGTSRSVRFPVTVDYGANGRYTIARTLPQDDALLLSPALCVYSNYMNLRVELDGVPIYAYAGTGRGAYAATGNTYHFIRLPAGYGGKRIVIDLECQLGDEITYLLKAPILGSKATMLRTSVVESMPSILLAGCMFVLAVVLAALYLSLRRRLELNNATAYTALFAALFSVYVFCETSFAQMFIPHGYSLFCCTLMLLAMLPIPLMGLFAHDVSARFRHVPTGLMLLCSLNLIMQTACNFTGARSFRTLLPCTHAVIIAAITVMVVCLILSDRHEKPGTRRKLYSALPMIAGGITDITLIVLQMPSFNNSLWFTLGVTSFIVIQFCEFVRSFFVMYRASLEASVLRDMAYRDALTNIGNRNAYERRLKELAEGKLTERLCCMVIDINDLKQINDRYGHATGDAAIVETSRILGEIMPESASCYRAGGDEFIVLINGFDSGRLSELVGKLEREAERRGKQYAIPLSLAVGYGAYEPSDGSILDFIRRIDTRMYARKRAYKESASYQFAKQ